MIELLKDARKSMMTGVSYMIPFVVAGGVMLALSVLLSG
ncbi:PTS fructose-like transporter subunit EIIC, partial [Streptococcus canis]